jgi:hypothetical protein
MNKEIKPEKIAAGTLVFTGIVIGSVIWPPVAFITLFLYALWVFLK